MEPTPTRPRDPLVLPREPGYTEAFILLGGLLVLLLAAQAIWAPRIPHLAPLPAALLVFLPWILLFLAAALKPGHPWVRFLAGVPFAVTSLLFTGAAALAGTLVIQTPSPQDALKLGRAHPLLQGLGLTDVFHSFWFAAQVVTLLLSLAFSAGRRLLPFNLANGVFLTTHVGTALVLAGGIFGNLTSRSGMLVLEKGLPSARLELQEGGALELPGPVTLTDFAVEPFPLEASLGMAQGDGVAPKGGGKALPSLHPGQSFTLGGWRVECLAAFPNAQPLTRFVDDPGGAPVLDLRLTAPMGETTLTLAEAAGRSALPGGVVTRLVECREGDVPRTLASIREAWALERGQALLYVSDGKALGLLARELGGRVTLREGAQALEPVTLGPLTFRAAHLRRARLESAWQEMEGLSQEPTGAARVVAQRNGVRREGWLAAGPLGYEWLPLEGPQVLLLMPPAPKTFRSDVMAQGRPHTIRVNSPLDLDGWQLTQTSFEVTPGGEPVSILRAMKDPSIPVVWTGLTLLLLGTLGALWILPSLLKGDQR
jgi:hypothetical protein